MKRALVSIFIAAVPLILLVSCGGGSSNSGNTTTTSGIKKRALISDAYRGSVYIIDAAKDTYLGNAIPAGSSATLMAEMPDKLHTIIVNPSSLSVFDNATESMVANYPMPANIDDIVVAPDNKTVYAAVRNAPFAGQLPGAVEIVDITSSTNAVAATIQVPQVRKLVLSHNGNKLLAFSDNTNSVAVIDTASKAVTNVSGFDRPVSGVFSSDDSTAYILSCGAECGGTTARVNTLTISNNAIGNDVVVSGATTGLLDSGNLYVAGTNAGAGKLDVISTSNMTVTKSGVAIANGYHTLMSLANGELFIGSTGCGNVSSGCLSVYNTSSSSVVNSTAGAGDVTGLQPISGRNIMYVAEGGELVIWDTTAVAPLPTAKQIDFVGQVYDVVELD